MTEAEIKAFRALADKACSAPWFVDGSGMGCTVSTGTGPHDRGYEICGGDGDWTHATATFVVAARNNAARLCDAALYALELERVVHDIQRGEAADLIAEARRQGREEMLAVWLKQYDTLGMDLDSLPPLPAESPTNHELRERAAAMEAENARLREALERIGSDRTHTAKDARSEARKALAEVMAEGAT